MACGSPRASSEADSSSHEEIVVRNDGIVPSNSFGSDLGPPQLVTSSSSPNGGAAQQKPCSDGYGGAAAPDFDAGAAVRLTAAGCGEIEADGAWASVPLRRGEVGVVVGAADEDGCLIVRGRGGEERGLHVSILEFATPQDISPASSEAAGRHPAGEGEHASAAPAERMLPSSSQPHAPPSSQPPVQPRVTTWCAPYPFCHLPQQQQAPPQMYGTFMQPRPLPPPPLPPAPPLPQQVFGGQMGAPMYNGWPPSMPAPEPLLGGAQCCQCKRTLEDYMFSKTHWANRLGMRKCVGCCSAEYQHGLPRPVSPALAVHPHTQPPLPPPPQQQPQPQRPMQPLHVGQQQMQQPVMPVPQPMREPAPADLDPGQFATWSRMTPEQRRNLLGEKLFPKVAAIMPATSEPASAAKVTGMLLEKMSTPELVDLLGSRHLLQASVCEAIAVLRRHSGATQHGGGGGTGAPPAPCGGGTGPPPPTPSARLDPHRASRTGPTPPAATPSGPELAATPPSSPPPVPAPADAACDAEEVATFLTQHLLDQFVDALIHEGYEDMATLRLASDEDLRSLEPEGMKTGHIKRFRRAIQGLR